MEAMQGEAAIAVACAGAATALLEARDLLAQAVGYCLLLDDDTKGPSLHASLEQVQATYDFVSTYVQDAKGDEE